ncbi:MAG: MarC family protein [Calditrichaceae bacterium]
MNDYVYSFFRSSVLLLMLLNPFLVILYLLEVVKKLSLSQFLKVLFQAGLISIVVFVTFAVLGDYAFNVLFQAEFASFQIFGGIIFLVIGLQFVFKGTGAIDILRGEVNQVAGALAMPILIGPGTISASVIIGKRLEPLYAALAIIFAVSTSLIVMGLLKVIHDRLKAKNEQLIERYTEVAGRILAIYVGTIAVEMIMQGMHFWILKIKGV